MQQLPGDGNDNEDVYYSVGYKIIGALQKLFSIRTCQEGINTKQTKKENLNATIKQKYKK